MRGVWRDAPSCLTQQTDTQASIGTVADRLTSGIRDAETRASTGVAAAEERMAESVGGLRSLVNEEAAAWRQAVGDAGARIDKLGDRLAAGAQRTTERHDELKHTTVRAQLVGGAFAPGSLPLTGCTCVLVVIGGMCVLGLCVCMYVCFVCVCECVCGGMCCRVPRSKPCNSSV